MRKTNKGFTIVELVIVIAVIAILAAVLIPTFVSLTKKANLSSDMQAVRQMNVALATEAATNGKPADLLEAMIMMKNAGYDFENYKPISVDHRFFWNQTENRIVLVLKNEVDGVAAGTIVFPKEEEGNVITEAHKPLYRDSLVSADVVEEFKDKIAEVGTSAPIEIATADELMALSALVNGATDKANTYAGYTFNLTADEYDISNSVWVPIGEAEVAPFSGKLIGKEGGTKIIGLTTEGYTTDVANATKLTSGQIGVSYGFIGFAHNATVENIIISEATIDLSKTGKEMGALVGYVTGNLTMTNCSIENSTVIGMTKVGGLVGHVDNDKTRDGKVVLTNCKNVNTTVKAMHTGDNGRAGGLVGTAIGGAIEFVNCEVTAPLVSAKDYAAGLISQVYNGITVKISGCKINPTEVKATEPRKGVYLIGYWANNSNHPVTITSTEVNGTALTEVNDSLFGYMSMGATANLVIGETTYKYTNSTGNNSRPDYEDGNSLWTVVE